MRDADGEQPFVVIPVGDSPDSRLFIELESFGSDLAEAHHALDLAIQGFDEESEFADACWHLVGFAVIAYCRAVMHSNVRGRLTDHVEVPGDLLEVHDRVKTYRNATVAHSQSELAVTYAMGVLDADSLKVRGVMGATLSVPLPKRVVRDFLTLIDAMELRLEEAIEPVRRRLMMKLADMDRSEVEAARGLEITERLASEFNPNTSRRRYPTGHTVYWDVAGDDWLKRFD